MSLAFNHKPGLAEATRDRIFTAARELGWEPNLTARSLAGARGDVVGLAICRPARLLGLEPFSMDFISGVESVLTEHSCSLLLRLVRTLEEDVGLQESWWKGRHIGGAILVDFRADDPRIPAVERLGMPAVAVGHPSLLGGPPLRPTGDIDRYVCGCRRVVAGRAPRRSRTSKQPRASWTHPCNRR